MVSSGVKKMLDLIISYIHESVSENVCPVICFGGDFGKMSLEFVNTSLQSVFPEGVFSLLQIS